jgi:hypothetical protein
MGLTYDTVTFLSDFGRQDEFVGIVHSVIRSIAPGVTVIDLTHDIAPYDVRAAGLTLARSAPYLCPGVVVAVVDPGVGTDRRAVAVEVGEGASVLVGPDNGLLAPAVALCGGADRAVVLNNRDFLLEGAGGAFDGRDVFAPAAAHLCNGVELTDLGEVIDPALLRPGLLPVSRTEGDAVIGEILWVDRYGNAQLNVDPDEIDHFGERVRLRFRDSERTAKRAASFDEVGVGEIGLVVDSYGLIAIVLDRGSAASQLGLDPGVEVTLEPFAGEQDLPGVTTSVAIGRPAREGDRP